ncbi:glycosyltransferase [Motilimonas cestriensis]|uniref:glycosyltransferase n=1 Tax=Motilimonas cestriensis TaxID=2742685 RepID=UPI003DA6C440
MQKITLDTARYHTEIGNQVSILALEEGIDLSIDFPCDYQQLNIHKAMLFRPWLAIFYGFYKLLLRNIFPHSEFIWDRFFYTGMVNRFLHNQASFDAIFVNGARAMSRMNGVSHPNIVFSLHLPNTLSGKPRSIYYNFLFRSLFKGKRVFCVSKFIENEIRDKAKQLEFELKNISTIHNPCDQKKIQALGKGAFDYDSKFILGVGRLSKQKRFDLLIEAYKQSEIDYKLVILGQGNQEKKLRELIKHLKLENKVELAGFDNNPFRWMKHAEFFVLSSDLEGWGLVLNEAIAVGTPVISTDCGPITEVLTGSLANGIVPKNNIDALAQKIAEFTVAPIVPPENALDRLSFANIIQQQMALAEAD